MRSGNDAKWAIHGGAVVEVRAPFLLGPAGTVGVWNTFVNRDTQVLVQRDEPVVVCRFVEERALNCTAR